MPTALPIDYLERFEDRHNGPNDLETQAMLEAIGAESLEQLINQTVPPAIQHGQELKLPLATDEHALLHELKGIAAKNKTYRSYIGMGYYGTHTPNVILRNVLENPGWYTQYTPYQAEIAQGRLEALLNFQTMVADLTGLELANASLLDEATAAAEAMSLAIGATRRSKNGEKFFVDRGVHPQTLALLYTRAEPLGIEIEVGYWEDYTPSKEYFAALLQYPTTEGAIEDYASFTDACHEQDMLVIAACDLLSLLLLKSPGSWGADIAVGSAQRFGVPMGYGGPHAAFFATKDEYKRQMPGRLVGVTIDKDGKHAYRLALQTREQHIKREKATSNICTAQALLAIMASMYAVYHGPHGLQKIALRVQGMTQLLGRALKELGFHLVHDNFFDTLKVDLGDNGGQKAERLRNLALEAGINLRYYSDEPTEDMDDTVGIALDETVRIADLQDIIGLFEQLASDKPKIDLQPLARAVNYGTPKGFAREDEVLSHPVFHAYHTETEMLRYLKRLENKDLSLAHSMIPLGSCTMKLNATAEMRPVTWPEFGSLHPFAPIDQAEGYQQIFSELIAYLSEITGFADVSLQPNSGAQGEYTGLLVIRAYHKSRGEGHRNVALIPSSAHGTNPASAVMAGMKVVIVGTDDDGNIDMEDLKAKAQQHSENLAALMVTYPSTHGVFETHIKEVCALIHEHGGQVYMDGANLNAQVGITSPGYIGADVCHLNLHKTFCIPHGGGGPGMGPIGVAKHLVPFLPTHPIVSFRQEEEALSPVSAAPFGSASILLISWMYIRLMGQQGLINATKKAILNANYIKARLEGDFKVLYVGGEGRVAHELIIDLRMFKQSAGIDAEDLAKRLMDYGFHAPTMSWPVPGTIMIEPTESESKGELDRFCDAMLAIRKEIAAIEAGTYAQDENLLKNAPHTQEMLMRNDWPHAYSREEAAYPLPWLRAIKFWPVVRRVDNTFGDRNLMCACPPMESYEAVEEHPQQLAVSELEAEAGA